MLEGTSVKIPEQAEVEQEPGIAASIPKQMNFAIACLCVKLLGQYIRGLLWHPPTIPRLYNASMYVQNEFDAGTSENMFAQAAEEQEPGDSTFIDVHINLAIACLWTLFSGQ